MANGGALAGPREERPPGTPWWRRKAILVPTASLAIIALVAITLVVIVGHRRTPGEVRSCGEVADGDMVQYGAQIELPFTDLEAPGDLAVTGRNRPR
jgi:hypothetical protein